jgi:beta-phosphoglucomutase-like phosphatase (HAD superfamily)
LGLLPDQAIAVEDNLDGYNAAVKAKLKCVAFPSSMQHVETFAKVTKITSNVAQSVIDAVESRIAA